MASNGHSELSPSASERWINCPGSVRLSEGLHEDPSPYAAEGTAAHVVAEWLVKGEKTLEEIKALVGTTIRTWDGFDVEVTDEMVDGAVLYRDTIEKDLAALRAEGRPAPVAAQAEEKVCASSVDKELWGTSDYTIFQKGNKLKVYDYKFGKGKVVDPEENTQMSTYALATMDTLAGEAFDEVELAIVQPRAPHAKGPVRRWITSVAWLRGFRERMRASVAKTREPDPYANLKAGKWCFFCKAKGRCPEIKKAVVAQAQVDFSVVPVPAARVKGLPSVDAMPPEKLAMALSWQDVVVAWFDAMHAKARGLLEAGVHVPGYKLVEGRSTRQWNADAGAVVAALSLLCDEDDLLTPRELKSPAQVEKVVGRGKLEKMNLVRKPKGGLAVAPADDPRPEVKPFGVVDIDPSAVSHDDLLDATMLGFDIGAKPHPSVAADLLEDLMPEKLKKPQTAPAADPLAELLGDAAPATPKTIDIAAELGMPETAAAPADPLADLVDHAPPAKPKEKVYKQIWP